MDNAATGDNNKVKTEPTLGELKGQERGQGSGKVGDRQGW